MIIQPIVEGPGDIQAIPSLLNRILVEVVGCPYHRIAPPMRLARGQMVQEGSLRKSVQIATLTSNYIMLFIDSDDDCCEVLHDLLTPWATREALTSDFDVIGIEREYECWLLAALESLRGLRGIPSTAQSPTDPSCIRGGKERLSKLMGAGTSYSETVDQAAFTRAADLGAILRSSSSFKRLVRKLSDWHSRSCIYCTKNPT